MSPTKTAAATRPVVAVLGFGLAVAGVVLLAPSAQAQTSIVQCQPFSNSSQLVTCDLCALYDMINTIISITAGALVGITTLMLIVGGFRYITSAGSPGLIESAKKTIQFAITGIIVVSLGFVIIKSVTTALGYTKDPLSGLECKLPEPTQAPGGTATPPSPRPGQQPTGPGASGQYADLLNQAAAKYGMEPCAMQALMQTESSGNPTAVNHNHKTPNSPSDPFDANNPPFYGIDWNTPRNSHDFGLLQVNITNNRKTWIDSNTPSTKRGDKFYTVSELLTPATNIDAGAAYLDYCLDKNYPSYAAAYGACYNAQGADGPNAKRFQNFYDACLNSK